MSNVALYTFGLVDPEMGPERLADFSARGRAIYSAGDHAPGLVGQAETGARGSATHTPGEDFGPWGSYARPDDLPGFTGHDPTAHIATLSLWQDTGSARDFVYQGIHRDALRLRYDWFFKGPWPGHVLWDVEEGVIPHWSDGVARLETLAREGESPDGYTFGSRWART